MINLFMRSMIVLALLFGLLFAVGAALLFYFDLPMWWGFLLAWVILGLQYLFGPAILQMIYKIEWRELETIDPQLANFIRRVCREKDMPLPRFGVIRDGNPNAFTFGHYPGDARLVITTGLVQRLKPAELEAVVAHELGHIARWDFVVMTVAAAVPLMLYMLYSTLRLSRGRRRGKSGGAILAVALGAYLAYIVSQFIVLLLSRVREYYADQFAAEVTGNPHALSTALVKVAYGLAAETKGDQKDDRRMQAGRAMGIFDPTVAHHLALAGAGAGQLSMATMVEAMKWDLWNPWATFFEIGSSHPLPAKRIQALEKQAQAMGQPARKIFNAAKTESYWDEFLVDLVANNMPLFGLILGLLVGGVVLVGFQSPIGGLGFLILMVSTGSFIKRWFSYLHRFEQVRSVSSLVSEIKVSAVRSIPCVLEGEIIGRGIPGLFFSEDLVIQDQSGYMVVDYRQPLRFLEFLFGWLKAEALIGKRVRAEGWYRRAPRPYFEMRRLTLEGGKQVTSYLYPVQQMLVYLGILLGLGLIGMAFLMMFV